MALLSKVNYSYLLVFLLAFFLNFPIKAHTNDHSGLDSDAAKAVLAFTKALQRGDAKAARALLAEDVLIYEGGGVERSAEEYASHHLKSDIAFMQAMKVTVLEHQVETIGNMAISTARSRLQGIYKNKPLNIETMETLVLIKAKGQWLIKHIHWSN